MYDEWMYHRSHRVGHGAWVGLQNQHACRVDDASRKLTFAPHRERLHNICNCRGSSAKLEGTACAEPAQYIRYP
jgi:hypothetical protein